MGNNKSPFRARQEPAQEKYKHRVRVLCNSSPAVSAYDIFWKGAAGSYLDTSCRRCLPVVYQPQVYEPQANEINFFRANVPKLGAVLFTVPPPFMPVGILADTPT